MSLGSADCTTDQNKPRHERKKRLFLFHRSTLIMSRQFAKRVFSGIQPTGGSLHLGNYFGAVQRWVRQVEEDEHLPKTSKIFSVVDMHAITLPQNPDQLRQNIRTMAASLLGCGLNPDKCILFQQSRVEQHAELAWILGCHINVPQLQSQTQYKEKSAKLKEIPLGLFVYPVLQSADILLYKTTEVPVGEDNVQNVQVAHQVCRSFNRKYGNVFPSPKIVVVDNEASRLRSLRNPSKKMSKSDPDTKSCIFITDPPEVVLEKCKKAVTDFIGQVTFDPVNRPGVSNLLSIHSGFTGETPDQICHSVRDLDTGQYKLHLAEVISESLQPIQAKIKYFEHHPNELDDILTKGADSARDIAQETMSQVRKVIGFS